MNFASPLAFWLAALAVPIVVFYILKIRLRRVPVSTIMFWRQIYEEKQPRSIWQHLRHLLSLLLQLLFLMLLVFALTDPFFHWEVLRARKLVLVIDNSASMQATDVAPTRLDAAKDEARKVLSGLRFRDELAIVAAGTQPQVLCGMTGHERTLRGVLDAVPATDGPTRVGDAVALARRLLGGRENSQVIVVSDGCFEGADELGTAKDVRLITVGQRTPNAGITRFQVRRSLLDPIGYQILAEVINASDESVECRLSIDLNDEVVDVVPLTLSPGQKWSQVFDKTAADGGRLVAKLERADALAVDNTATAILPPRELVPVVLVTEPNLFLEKVFEANPLASLTVVRDLDAQALPSEAVKVFHRTVPKSLPPGPVLVIDPAESTELWELGETIANPIVTKQDEDSLLMKHVKLENVLMPEARRLALKGEPQVLVAALEGEPLYSAITRPDGNVLVLTVNLDQGDLPLRTAFPIMATNALSWLAGNSGELREAIAAGGTADVELKDGAALSLWTPGGAPRPLPAGVTQTTIGPLDRCGVWSVAAAGAENRPGEPVEQIACNLASRDESDIRPPEALLKRETGRPLLAGFGLRPVWYYAVALAWLLTALEWWLYQRRWIS